MHTIATASQAKIEHITQKDVCSVPLQMSHTWEQCTGEKKGYVCSPICLDSLHNGCTGPWQLIKDPDPTLGSDAHPSLKVKGWPDAGGEITKKGRIEGWGTLRSHCDWNAESMEKGRGSMGAEAAEINLWRPLRTPLESLYFILWVKDFFYKGEARYSKTQFTEHLRKRRSAFSTHCFNIWPRLQKFFSGYSKLRCGDNQLKCCKWYREKIDSEKAMADALVSFV